MLLYTNYNVNIVFIHTMLLFSCSVASDSVTPWTAAGQAPLSFTVSWSLLKLIVYRLGDAI